MIQDQSSNQVFPITVGALEQMEPGPFAKGMYAEDGKEFLFVAVRGQIGDWAIYASNVEMEDEWDYEGVKDFGDKIHRTDLIRKLVVCTDEAFALYRH